MKPDVTPFRRAVWAPPSLEPKAYILLQPGYIWFHNACVGLSVQGRNTVGNIHGEQSDVKIHCQITASDITGLCRDYFCNLAHQTEHTYFNSGSQHWL